MRSRGFAVLVALLCFGAAIAAEDSDFGIPPTRELRLRDYAAPTPLEAPGAHTIRTPQLRALLAGGGKPPMLIDVVDSEEHDSLPGAVWLPGAGRGSAFDDPLQATLARALRELAGGDRSSPVVFFCSSARCWLSYNASLRAIALGYREVYWYRGGIEAWIEADGELHPVQRRWRR